MEKLAQSLGVTKEQFITLSFFAFLIISLPASFYLARIAFNKPVDKDYQTYQDRSQAPKDINAYFPVTSPAPDLESQIKEFLSPAPTVVPTTSPVSDTSSGPTLNMKISIESRPKTNYQTKAFVGIAKGAPTTKPQYLLSFTVDFPKSGIFNGLGLAGLETGTIYTVYIKGAAQVDSAASFTLRSTVNSLGSEPIKLISGDLNEDNVIDSSDYSLTKSLYGTTSSSSNWNERADLNMDGIVNNIDLLYVNKNIGKTGASGVWYSRITTPAGSTGLEKEATEEVAPSEGYWLWIPPSL